MSDLKILVINEPFIPQFCRTQRWAARTRGRVLRAPDWLAYATAVLERDITKAEVRLYDFPAMNWNKIHLKHLIRNEKPDFVVLDSTTPSIFSDIECARIVKENSDAKVIMVGPHASALPEETLKLSGGSVDVIAIGEYDYTVRDIIKNFNKLREVKGICFWEKGQPVRTEKRPLIENLDELPFPAWHHLDLMKYFDGGKLYPYIDIISGRGCPNRCIFCLWPQVMHGFRYRLRSPKNVVDEIEYDIKLCPQVLRGGEFFFEDDTFTVNKKRAMEICEEILRRGLKITFSVNGRVDNADLEMFRMMKRAGCREILVGFESGVQEILDNVNKNITLEQSRKFMELARKAGLQVHACFVIGLPGETRETAKKTIEFALELDPDTVQFSGAVPFPGTKFFHLAKKEGWLKATSWEDWLQEGEQSAVIDLPGLSQKEIDHYVNLGLKKFYFRPGYMLKFLIKTRGYADLYRKIRGAYNFISYLLTNK
ncbi:MAG: B12-binding domain-containing radical SAM protein [Caldiserica bacterium]|nr:MAG: B12-binding domain-containing radical SAM protein [Caldisericota bacterium]